MIRISHIKAKSLVDGPGERTVLFMQGCPIACPGCQNRHLWDSFSGRLESEIDVADTLVNLALEHGNITISGGEPFSQPFSLIRLLRRIREYNNIKHIIVYTGYLYEDLLKTHAGILQLIDVLVDGPFVHSEDDSLITYRGSRNQRPIDIFNSMRSGNVMTLDWDSPEIVIDLSGDMVVPVGMVSEFKEIGTVENTRRCGQTK